MVYESLFLWNLHTMMLYLFSFTVSSFITFWNSFGEHGFHNVRQVLMHFWNYGRNSLISGSPWFLDPKIQREEILLWPPVHHNINTGRSTGVELFAPILCNKKKNCTIFHTNICSRRNFFKFKIQKSNHNQYTDAMHIVSI